MSAPQQPEDAPAEDMPGRGQFRNGLGRFSRDLDTASKDAAAVRLRSRGMTLAQVAAELGYCDASAASKAISRALAAVPAEGVDALRRMQSERLDYLLAKALEVLESKHYAHSQSGQLLRGPDGEVLLDDGPVLAAIDRIVRIEERRARLMGLDAPTRLEVVTLDQLDSWIAQVQGDLAGGGIGPMDRGAPLELGPGDGEYGEDSTGGERP